MTTKTGTNIVSLDDARQRKDAEAPLEACAPQAHKVDGDDAWHITGSDGEQTYIWLAYKKSKRSKRYTIVEVWPGMTKKRTALRDVRDASELELEADKGAKGVDSISDVLEELEGILFQDIEFEDDDDDETLH
jgi:hypothetical protein